jgi:NAD(P)H-dependent flavin oxidoreductase YrpB (nitropropane dioxygenase family)
LPIIAAGGVSTPAQVVAVVRAGADAAMVGTILLRTYESGASTPYKTALTDLTRTETVVTRAFTGRPARALRNRFTDRYSAIAPTGYPALHNLTGPLRGAATAAGDLELMSLWAGTGFRNAKAEPAVRTIARLAALL